MWCFADRASWHISMMKQTWCTFHSVYWESKAATCFEHCLLILRRRSENTTVQHNQLTLYVRSVPNAVCLTPPEDEQVMLETCRSLWFSINWMKKCTTFFSLYWWSVNVWQTDPISPHTSHYSTSCIWMCESSNTTCCGSLLHRDTKKFKGHAVVQWLRHCATNREVAGSIPDGFRIFHWHTPSGRLSL
jgi:hypothetical protein